MLQGLAELVTYVEVVLNLMHRMTVTMDNVHLDFTVKKERQTVLCAQKELSGLMVEPRLAMIACHAPVVNTASSRESLKLPVTVLQDITALLRKTFAYQSPANSSVQEDISVQMVLLTHSVVPQGHIRAGNTRHRVISAQKVITVWQILLIHILVQHIITAPTELILQLSVQMGRLRMTMLPSWVIWISADHVMSGTFVNWELSQVTVLQDTCVTLGAPLLLQTAQTKQSVTCVRLGSTVLQGRFMVCHVDLD